MAKPHTFPTLFDDVKHIDVTRLKKWGYLDPGQIKEGRLTWKWRSDGSMNGSIDLVVNTIQQQPYIELTYTYNRESNRTYKVNLVSTPSNLGKGEVWYFVCPHTNKRCRKLYLVGGYFLHREAFKGCMYESQTYSKKYRELDKTMGAYLRRDSHYEELHKKHFKKTYAGKPTKSYLRIMKKIQMGSRSERAL